jgi:hypothetical protein
VEGLCKTGTLTDDGRRMFLNMTTSWHAGSDQHFRNQSATPTVGVPRCNRQLDDCEIVSYDRETSGRRKSYRIHVLNFTLLSLDTVQVELAMANKMRNNRTSSADSIWTQPRPVDLSFSQAGATSVAFRASTLFTRHQIVKMQAEAYDCDNNAKLLLATVPHSQGGSDPGYICCATSMCSCALIDETGKL